MRRRPPLFQLTSHRHCTPHSSGLTPHAVSSQAPTLVLNASDPLFNVSLAFDFWPGYVWRDGLYDTQEQCDAGRCSDPQLHGVAGAAYIGIAPQHFTTSVTTGPPACTV